MRNPKSDTRNWKSDTRNWKSEIRKLEIRNQQIRNQKSRSGNSNRNYFYFRYNDVNVYDTDVISRARALPASRMSVCVWGGGMGEEGEGGGGE